MRIYLAARFGRREELRGYREQLETAGHVVTSRWLVEEHDLPIDAHPSAGAKFASDDVNDILNSDCVISFTEEPGRPPSGSRARGGRHVEFGLAIALSAVNQDGPMRVLVVGWRENVFHYLPEVEFFGTWAEALAALGTAP